MTAGSKPIRVTGRPQGVRPRSLNSDQCDSPDLPEIWREHPVPSPVSISRTHPKPKVQRSGAAGFSGNEESWFNHARYDGFGNLSSKTLNGALQSIPVNPQTNRLTNAVYDGNGNMTSGVGASLVYNVENRMVRATELSGGMEMYWYAPDGKRTGRSLSDGTQLFMLYGIQGEQLGTYTNWGDSGRPTAYALSMNVYFAGRLIWQGSPIRVR